MTVREPFAYGAARRYPLESIVHDAGATLLVDELLWVDPAKQTIHTKAERAIEYGALMLALGAKAVPRYAHALTIDDRRLDETLHGLIQDVEGGYIHSLAFVSPGRMAWPLPLYELALMTAGRATTWGSSSQRRSSRPEDSPAGDLRRAAQATPWPSCSTEAKSRRSTPPTPRSPARREVVINPGDRHLQVDRVIALPELYGPSCAASRWENTASSASTLRACPRCRTDLRRRRRDRLPDQARRDRLPAGRRGRAVDRGAGRGGRDPRTVSSSHPRHAAHRRQAAVPHRSHHRRARVQLRDHRRADAGRRPSKIAAKYLAPYLETQDRGALPGEAHSR